MHVMLLIRQKGAEHQFRKSLIILYRVYALQLNFIELLCDHLLSPHKSLSSNKLISAKFLHSVISRNKHAIIILSTQWYYFS